MSLSPVRGCGQSRPRGQASLFLDLFGSSCPRGEKLVAVSWTAEPGLRERPGWRHTWAVIVESDNSQPLGEQGREQGPAQAGGWEVKQKGQRPGPEEGTRGGCEQAQGRRRRTEHGWPLVRFDGGREEPACVWNPGVPRCGGNIPEAPLQRGAGTWGRSWRGCVAERMLSVQAWGLAEAGPASWVLSHSGVWTPRAGICGGLLRARGPRSGFKEVEGLLREAEMGLS